MAHGPGVGNSLICTGHSLLAEGLALLSRPSPGNAGCSIPSLHLLLTDSRLLQKTPSPEEELPLCPVRSLIDFFSSSSIRVRRILFFCFCMFFHAGWSFWLINKPCTARWSVVGWFISWCFASFPMYRWSRLASCNICAPRNMLCYVNMGQPWWSLVGWSRGSGPLLGRHGPKWRHQAEHRVVKA